MPAGESTKDPQETPMPNVAALKYTKDTEDGQEVHRFEFIGAHESDPLELRGELKLSDLVRVAWHLMDALGLGRPPELELIRNQRS